MARSTQSDYDEDEREPSEFDAYTGQEPPAVPESDLPAGTVQLMVQVVRQGRPSELGYEARNVTTTDIVTKHRAALPNGGTIWLFPVNMAGKMLRAQPFVKDIDPNHEVYRIGQSGATVIPNFGQPGAPFVVNPTPAAQPMPIQFVEMLNRSVTEREKTIAAREAAIERRAQELADEQAALGKIRLATTEEMNKTTWEAQQRVFEASRVKEESTSKDVLAFMSKQLEVQANQANQNLQLIIATMNSSAENLKAFYTAQSTAEANRAAAAIKEAEAKAKREEADAVARVERERADHDREMERLRARIDAEKEASLTKRGGNPMADAIGMFAPILTLMKTVGIEPKDIVDKFFNAGAGSTVLDAVARIGEKAADTMLELKKLDLEYGVEAHKGQDGDVEEMVKLKFPDGSERVVTKAEAQQIMAAAQAQADAQRQQIQARQQQQAPQLPQGQQQAPQVFIAPKGPPPAAQPAAAPAALTAGQLNPRQVKAARIAARKIGDILLKHMSLTDDQAFGMAMLQDLGTQESPELEAYVMLNRFAPVMREAQIPEASIRRICGLLKVLQQQDPPAFDPNINLDV